jgi:predicted nucleic acid-binding protein
VIILDANVLIAYLDDTDQHHDATIELLVHRFADGFGCNVLTMAEALVHPSRMERQDAAMSSLERIGIKVIASGVSDVPPLARIRSTYRVRMPDAVALHTALSTRSELATFDEQLSAAAGSAGVRLAIRA